MDFMRKTKSKKGVVSYVQARTQAVTWAERMLKGWDASKAITWDYRTINNKDL